MVERPCNPHKQLIENENNMILPIDIEQENAINKPTQIDLIFAHPHFLFFCQHTNGTFAKPHKPSLIQSFAKEPFFPNTQ